jgi:DNA-binding CsgD family transcriptional regulator
VRGVVGEAAPPRANTFGLSRREYEVLGLISEGRTNREIGERLFISQKTVGVHVGNILAKLGVSGRVEAAAVAIRLGLTGDEAIPAGSGRRG